jgi:uncharacterized protein YndB with AHSA1/START domain
MADFTLTRQIDAAPEVVFDTITDHRRYSDYTPIRRAELEREGDEEPNGKGAIRALHLAGPPMRERVVAFERPHLFTYELLSGLPVRDHVGTVTLDARDGGTLMTYRIETTPTILLSGPAVVGGMRIAIGRLIAAVQREAEGRPTPEVTVAP